jgi:hypothetical protein
MMAITLVRLPLDGLVALAALGFEGATRGRFLARSIFLCRLVGKEGTCFLRFSAGRFLYSILPQRRKGAKKTLKHELLLCAFAPLREKTLSFPLCR